MIADPRWLCELAFLSDITEHLDISNEKLQGKENLISDMFAILKVFLSKLDLFKDQIAKGTSHILVTVKQWLLTMKVDWDLTEKSTLKL